MRRPSPLVVVGGGVAAAKLVESYRTAGGDGRVVVISEEDVPPYNRPLLGRFCVEDGYTPVEIAALPRRAYDELGVELVLGSPVVTLDPTTRQIVLSTGEPMRYGTLVIATGAVPRVPPFAMSPLAGISTFRTYRDASSLRDAPAGRIVVAGGGFLGCELAASLRGNGHHVTLAEPGPDLLPGLRSPELSAQVAALLRAYGVEVVLAASVSGVVGHGGSLAGVTTVAGLLRASRLVLASGVEPNDALLRSAGARSRHGLYVDRRLRTSLPDVYAVGDVCGLPGNGHWQTAVEQGTTLGRRLAGAAVPLAGGKDALPGFHVRLFDVRLHAIGDFEARADDVDIEGSIAQHRLLATLRRGGRVVAGVALNQPPATLDRLRSAIRAGMDEPLATRINPSGRMALAV